MSKGEGVLMVMSVDFVVIGMWAAQLFYVLCYIPQIFKNFQCKSGRGISDLMLLGYYWCLVAVLYYVFLCDLPLAYRLLPPVQFAAVIVLILQRLLYEPFAQTKKFWLLYGGSACISLAFMPIALTNVLWFGWLAGWAMFIIACVYQLPQIIKIFRKKSVDGFSIYFVLFLLIASFVELVTSVLLGLPIQTLFTALRGVIVCLIWLGQFWLYKSL